VRKPDEVLKVKARAVRRRDGVWDLYVTCPYCGKKDHHGGGNGEVPNLGFRVALAGLMYLSIKVYRSTNWYEHNCR
jgi:hypothetical protein